MIAKTILEQIGGRRFAAMRQWRTKKVAKKPLCQSTIAFTKTSFNYGNNQTERKNHLAQQ